MHQVDRSVGRIRDILAADGALDDTIVVFTSDHGDFLGDHGCIYKSIGAHHCLLHTPLVIRAPGAGLPARCDTAVSSVDVMPTVLAAAGIPAPEWLHGRDLMRPGKAQDGALAFTFNGDPRYTGWTIYDDRYRLSFYPNADWAELYDHGDDPEECRNRAAERPKAARDLRAALCARLPAITNPASGRMCSW